MTVQDLMERIVVGGWPALLDQSGHSARGWLADYLAPIVDIDIPEPGTGERTPDRLRGALASLGRSVGTAIKLTALIVESPKLGGKHRSLGTTLHAQLRQHPRHVVLDRFFGQKHPVGDLLIRQTLGQETQ